MEVYFTSIGRIFDTHQQNTIYVYWEIDFIWKPGEKGTVVEM